jgi:integrase
MLLNPRDSYILSCLFYLGLRAHEITSIKHSDFFINNGVLMLKIIGKGKKERTIRVSDFHSEKIKNYLETIESKSEYILKQKTRCNGEMVSVESIQKRIQEMSKLSGIKFSAHSGRYTVATNLYMIEEDGKLFFRVIYDFKNN